MEPYRNLSGNSGVIAFEIGADFIKVQFQGGRIYVYDYASPGQVQVEEMKSLAIKGIGLGSYISKYVRKAYAAKLP